RAPGVEGDGAMTDVIWRPKPAGVVIAEGPPTEDGYRITWSIAATTRSVALYLPDFEYNSVYRLERVWRYDDGERSWWRRLLRPLPSFDEACDEAFKFAHRLKDAQARLADQVEVRRILETL